uniref:Uncharacterized protein n=1 Tax=Lotharella oceanica TaxID=641309 RepID=A0A7S2XH72_9EUKA|mmetsp:Transcript_5812/g.11515  ORF Transcript_5812/g.11515 Transcript_5812/m.11515 type:complete len:116 (+) Transcript_5812:191-538(+)
MQWSMFCFLQGRESRIRSSLSCEHIPLSSNLFSPVNLFSDKSLNDRKLQNPFGGDDLLMGATGGGGGGGAQSYMRDTPALFDNSTSGIKSPTFPSLANIDSMFFKEFSAWEADCE